MRIGPRDPSWSSKWVVLQSRQRASLWQPTRFVSSSPLQAVLRFADETGATMIGGGIHDIRFSREALTSLPRIEQHPITLDSGKGNRLCIV